MSNLQKRTKQNLVRIHDNLVQDENTQQIYRVNDCIKYRTVMSNREQRGTIKKFTFFKKKFLQQKQYVSTIELYETSNIINMAFSSFIRRCKMKNIMVSAQNIQQNVKSRLNQIFQNNSRVQLIRPPRPTEPTMEPTVPITIELSSPPIPVQSPFPSSSSNTQTTRRRKQTLQTPIFSRRPASPSPVDKLSFLSFMKDKNKIIQFSLLEIIEGNPQFLSKTSQTPEEILDNRVNRKNQYFLFNGFKEFTINRRIVHEVGKCFQTPQHIQLVLNALLTLQDTFNDYSPTSFLQTLVFSQIYPQFFNENPNDIDWEIRALKTAPLENRMNQFSASNDKNLISMFVLFKRIFSPTQVFKADNYVIRQFDPNIHTIYVEVEKTYLLYNKTNPKQSIKFFLTCDFYITVDPQTNRIVLDETQFLEPPTIQIKHTSYVYNDVEYNNYLVSNSYNFHKSLYEHKNNGKENQNQTLFSINTGTSSNNATPSPFYYTNYSNKNTFANLKTTKNEYISQFNKDKARTRLSLNGVLLYNSIRDSSIDSWRELLVAAVMQQFFYRDFLKSFTIYMNQLFHKETGFGEISRYIIINVYDTKVVIDYVFSLNIWDENGSLGVAVMRYRAIFTLPKNAPLVKNSATTDVILKNSEVLIDFKLFKSSVFFDEIESNVGAKYKPDMMSKLTTINTNLNNTVFLEFYDFLHSIYPHLNHPAQSNIPPNTPPVNANIIRAFRRVQESKNSDRFKDIPNFDFLQSIITFLDNMLERKPELAAQIQDEVHQLYGIYYRTIRNALYSFITQQFDMVNRFKHLNIPV